MSIAERSQLTPDVLEQMAIRAGACIRPLMSRVTDVETGRDTVVGLPCGSTRASLCQSCAERGRRVRMQQCREGWHLDHDPEVSRTPTPGPDESVSGGERPASEGRRSRSTRRRSDAPDLPRVAMDSTTVGRAFVTPSGRSYRPSMFVTLTLPSYGPVDAYGVPRRPETYDYRRAALDAIHFSKLIDRFWQNLRRCAGYHVQYFSAIEEQRRLAPHLHAGIRGSIPRTLIRQVAAATYHQVWWPQHDRVVYEQGALPTWQPTAGRYVDGDGVMLPTWAEALDALDVSGEVMPAHVVRLGDQLDIQGIVAESGDADRRVAYLCKYLTKSISETHDDGASSRMRRHAERLHEAVRWSPCSPECWNWIRYGVQPRGASEGMMPGACPKRAHDRENLGLGGRRVLVSRLWTGKTLKDHRADRMTVVREVLAEVGMDPPEIDRMASHAADGSKESRPRYRWERMSPADGALGRRQALLASIAERIRWRQQYDRAKKSRCGVSHMGPHSPPVSVSGSTREGR